MSDSKNRHSFCYDLLSVLYYIKNIQGKLDGSASDIADVNGDGLVNIQDVIEIVNVILNGRVEPPDPQNYDKIQTDISISRTSGVAPLSVLFDTSKTTAVNTERPFHELDYFWEFGDPENGTWVVSGLSKNVDKGPLAAHVFEMPGTYTITLGY